MIVCECGHDQNKHAITSGVCCAFDGCTCVVFKANTELVDVSAAIEEAVNERVLEERQACADVARELLKNDFDGQRVYEAILNRVPS